MQVVSSASYSPQAKARGLARVNQALAERRRHCSRQRSPLLSWRPLARPLMVGFASVILVIMAAGGTTVAASNTVPGDPLYWVKTTRESVEMRIPHSNAERARMHAELASERGEEIRVLVSRGDYSHIERVMSQMRYHLGQSANHAGVVLPPDPVEMPARPVEMYSIPNVVVLRQMLERDGTVMKNSMTHLVQEASPPEKRKIRRILHQSDLGYQLVIHALDNDSPAAQGPFFRIDSFLTASR
jgi:hypothetical protein